MTLFLYQFEEATMDIECTRYIYRVQEHSRRHRMVRERATINRIHGEKVRGDSRMKEILLIYSSQKIPIEKIRNSSTRCKKDPRILECKRSSSTSGGNSKYRISDREKSRDILHRRHIPIDRQLYTGLQVKDHILGAQVDSRRVSKTSMRYGSIPIQDGKGLYR